MSQPPESDEFEVVDTYEGKDSIIYYDLEEEQHCVAKEEATNGSSS